MHSLRLRPPQNSLEGFQRLVPEYQEAGLPPSGCLGTQPLSSVKHTFRFLPPSFPSRHLWLLQPSVCVSVYCVLVSVG